MAHVAIHGRNSATNVATAVRTMTVQISREMLATRRRRIAPFYTADRPNSVTEAHSPRGPSFRLPEFESRSIDVTSPIAMRSLHYELDGEGSLSSCGDRMSALPPIDHAGVGRSACGP